MRSPIACFLALALVLFAAAPLRAAIEDDIEGFDGPKLTNARMAAKLMPQSGSVAFVGFTPGAQTPANPWAISTVRATSIARPAGRGGHWDWEHPAYGDSFQGWWPVRTVYTSTGGRALDDWNRPWWAVDIGNRANAAPIEGRTTGVTGVWHRDDGFLGTMGADGVMWMPLVDGFSAWMGLRRHGDTRFVDPITGNPFNADVLALNGVNAVRPSGNDKGFPGYGSQMDQMLYRDIDMTGVPAAGGLAIGLMYQTNMSEGFQTAPATRTGWFENDPLQATMGPANAAPGNFISNGAADATDLLAPRDRFTVYVGSPAEGTFIASDGFMYPIFDPQRRWLSEVIRVNEGLSFELLSVTGDTPPLAPVLFVPPAVLGPLLAASPKVRVVFRVKTNRGYDDEGLAYSSGGMGAAVVDEVTYAHAGGVSPPGWGTFELASSIDNHPAVDPLSAWKSTGKPPGVYPHPHALVELAYEDLCGPPGSPDRTCAMDGVVMSLGDHDNIEAAGGLFGTAELDRADGFVSPAIPLATDAGGTPNAIGLVRADLDGARDLYVDYEIYTGALDLDLAGNGWRVGVQCYPAEDRNGNPDWGQIRFASHIQYNPDPQCFRTLEPLMGLGLVRTSNPSGVPDSIRIYLGKVQQSFRFPPAFLPRYEGAYVDNVSLTILGDDDPHRLSAEIWDWFQDTFPFNEAPGLPGTVAFDTTSALIRTGRNVAAETGTTARCDVPGQHATITAADADRRVDLVFRILPGPGNYVTIGSPASGLRKLPTSPAPIVPGDLGNFWSSYIAFSGPFGTPGGHLGGVWDPSVWNSARCDTVEDNVFAYQGRGVIGGPADVARWRTTYHEADPKYAGLGIVHDRCFVATADANVTDLVCGAVPAYIGAPGVPTPVCPAFPVCGTGFDGAETTIEGTPIIPDGLLTPGAHVEYYFRVSAESAPGLELALMPDRDRVVPQYAEGSMDAHRWAEFGILPDRWKSPAYIHPVRGTAGSGLAAMLVVDVADRRGNEHAWVTEAGILGATIPAHAGAHNGWDGAPGDDPNDPGNFVEAHGGQAGTTWDLYQVKAGESVTVPAGTLGSRIGPPGPPCDGRSRQGPTAAMLAAYYKTLLVLTGDVSRGVLGPFADRGQGDVATLEAWLESGAVGTPDRGLWMIGDGHQEASYLGPGLAGAFADDHLGVDLAGPNYRIMSGNPAATTFITTDPAVTGAALTVGLDDPCTSSADVILRSGTLFAETQVASEYEDVGGGPYGSGVIKNHTAANPWIAVTDGFNLEDVTDVPPPLPGPSLLGAGYDRFARSRYLFGVLKQRFDPIAQISGTPTVPLDAPRAASAATNHMSVAGNPLNDVAIVRFGLARADHVVAGVYDVAGRRVRALADRAFGPGEHALEWDGADDAGRRLSPGVYLTRVRYRESGFEEAAKVTILR